METITLCFSPWHEVARFFFKIYTRDRGIANQCRKMDEMHNYTKQEPDCLNSSAGVLTLRAIASL